jgi:hypothetical protein
LTLRQLVWMAEGGDRAAWARLAVLLALLANCHRDPKKGRAVTADDMDPYALADGRRRTGTIDASTPEGLAMMREAFSGFKTSSPAVNG